MSNNNKVKIQLTFDEAEVGNCLSIFLERVLNRVIFDGETELKKVLADLHRFPLEKVDADPLYDCLTNLSNAFDKIQEILKIIEDYQRFKNTSSSSVDHSLIKSDEGNEESNKDLTFTDA